MAEQTDVVAEFIKDLVPKDLVETAQLLVSLGFPIPDKQSLVRLLKKRKADDPKGEKGFPALARPIERLLESVAGPFKAEDFGIDSPRGALEKFFARTGQDDAFLPFPGRRSWTLPDLPPYIPGPRASRNPFFGPDDDCGREAERRWRQHLKSNIARWAGPNEEYYFELQRQAEDCRKGWPFLGS